MRKPLIAVAALVLFAAIGVVVWAGLLVGLPEAHKRMAVTTRAGDLYAELRKLHQGARQAVSLISSKGAEGALTVLAQ